MRLPTLDRVAAAAGQAARRFPVALACAVVAAVSGMLLIDSSNEELFERLLYASTLGLPLFVGLTFLAERRGWSGGHRALVRVAGLLALAALFFLYQRWSEEVAALRYVQLSVAFHLFAAFAPFIRAGTLNGFWQYNRSLFLRGLTTAVFAGVLFVGLSGALAGVDNLLGVDVEGETYGRLWFFIAFVFGTWFFLGGVPDDLEALDSETDYPAVIKVFSQFILTPIVTVYLTILTIYLGKILVTRVWPSGWIGYLVSGVAVVGILSLLLVHPIEEKEENRWIRTYARWFYVALVPSIVMLLLAIWQRIDQYGVTEKRYFLVVLSLWLAGISVYYIVTRSRNIKVIPTTLCLVALVTFAGPWGAYAVSLRSQTARFERLLAANDMLVDGQARAASTAPSFDDRKEMSAILRYLAETHGTASIDPLFGRRLAEIDTVAQGLGHSTRGEADRRADVIVASLNVEYVGRWAAQADESAFHLHVQRGGMIVSVAEFDMGLRGLGTTPDSVMIDGRAYEFDLDEDRAVVMMRRSGETLIEIPLGPVIERAREHQVSQVGTPRIPQDIMYLELENERVHLAVYVNTVAGTLVDPATEESDASRGERFRVTTLSADYYWSEKPAPALP